MQTLAIYDMDKTITRRATYAAWLLFWARRHARWRLLLAPIAGVYALLYALRLLSRAGLKERNQALFMGDTADPAQVAAAAREFAVQQCATNMRGEALAQIAADRAAGYRVIIATASYGFYADAIGAALGVADVIGTAVVIDSQGLRARIAGANCYGAAKRAMVEAWIAAHGLAGAPIHFYSDHVSDAPMLELAAEPVAANPSEALRALATSRGWKTVDWD